MSIVGGTRIKDEKKKLTEQNNHIIVATLGRITDLIRREWLNTNRLTIIGLIEAD